MHIDEAELKIDFGKIVAEIRKLRGLSQEQLVSASGVKMIF